MDGHSPVYRCPDHTFYTRIKWNVKKYVVQHLLSNVYN